MRRAGKTKVAEWSGRLAGLVLCAFFGLGLFAGLSVPGRAVALKGRDLLAARGWRALVPVAVESRDPLRSSPRPAGAVALVARNEGFYALSGEGELTGPLSPDAEGDLPVLSGPGLDRASTSQLLEYAALLVRAEAALGALISEMRLSADGTASLYLARFHTEVVLDLGNAPLELGRAAEVMSRWRSRRDLIAALDMTTPGQAVMRLHGDELAAARGRRAALAAVTGQSPGSPAAPLGPRTKEPARR